MKSRPTSSQPPILDEGTFQQLLAAAYVVQEHADRLRPSKDAEANYANTLVDVVETEQHIRGLDLQSAMRLIAEKAQALTNAGACAIGLVHDTQLVYRVATGSAASEAGSWVRSDLSLAADCLRGGKFLQSPDAMHDPRLDPELCRRKTVKSLLSAPIQRDGKIAAVLELRFSEVNGFCEDDVRACQLVAGVLAGAIARNAERGWKQALASSEEAAVLEAWEHVKQTSTAVPVDGDDDFVEAATELGFLPAGPTSSAAAPPTSSLPPVSQFYQAPSPDIDLAPVPTIKDDLSLEFCHGCGHEFVANESFCAICGKPRSSTVSADTEVPADGSPMSAWPSLWDIQDQEQRERGSNRPQRTNGTLAESRKSPRLSRSDVTRQLPTEIEDIVERLSDHPEVAEARAEQERDEVVADEWNAAPSDLQEVPDYASSASGAQWTSAAKTREWLESLQIRKPWFMVWKYRATIYLAVASLLLLFVIASWTTQPTSNTPAARPASSALATQSQASSAPELTAFEKLLVNLGLADTPEPAVYAGNPETRVWVDVHTALYYCPGSELYGRTKGGKFATQRDAQQDRFEPATRKACK